MSGGEKYAGTKIKLCGMRRKEDILAVNEIRPDYIGFIFAEGFRRTVTPEKARELREWLDEGITPVGVFVDSPAELAARMLNEHIIRIAQLHGNEDEDYIRRLRSLIRTDAVQTGENKIQIMKAFKITGDETIRAAQMSGADMILLDAGTGAGKTFDWRFTENVKRPFFLAGGLTPENVTAAIRQVHPFGVDVSSGVETDGFKDPEKMKRFAEAVRSADEQMRRQN